jgi:hypothetical protein
MHATVGERMVIMGHHVGEPDRNAEIIEVRPGGGPPYMVRWDDTGHEALFFPGSDAVVQHFEHTARGAAARVGQRVRARANAANIRSDTA